jgi:integrase
MPPAVRDRLDQLHSHHRRRASRIGHDPHLLTLATLRHRIASLQALHKMLGLDAAWQDDPRVRFALRAAPRRIARNVPAMLRTPKAPLLREHVMRMIDACADDGPVGLRDAALLWIAFGTGGRRRAELAGMRWEHLHPDDQGAIWNLVAAKGRVADSADGVMRLPIIGQAWAALLRWQAEVRRQAPALATTGPVFRRMDAKGHLRREALNGHGIWSIVRQRAAAVGIDPDTVGAHSLRSGAATSFLLEGGALADASAMLGHRRLDTTRQHYDRRSVPLDAIRKLAEKTPPEGGV